MSTLTRRPRVRNAVAVAIAVAALALSACTAGSAPEETAEPTETAEGSVEPTTVRFGFLRGLATYPVQVAAEQGFFEEHGIVAEIPQVTNPTTLIPGLDTEYDVAGLNTTEILEATTRGAELTAISGFVFTSSENANAPFLSSAETGPIETAEDMAGLTIGLSSVSGAAANAIRWVLDDAGLGADAANLVVVPFPAMIDQINAGLIDAAIAPAPFTAAAVSAGLVVGADPMVGAAGDPAAVLTFASSPGWAEANGDLVEGLRAALDEAVAYIESNPDEALAGAAEWLDLPLPAIEGSTFPPVSSELDASQLEAWARVLTDTGVLTQEIDIDALIFAP